MNQPHQEIKTDLEKYRDAVWAFILEHCDVTDSGKLFVKFHMDNRKNFENRIWARYQYDYHREDYKAKEQGMQKTFIENKETKKSKRERFVMERKKRYTRKELEKKIEEWTKWYETMQHGGKFKRIIGYILSITWKKKPRE